MPKRILDAYHFDSDWDYYDQFLCPFSEEATRIIENDLLTSEDWECIVEDHWEEVTGYLEESGRVYDWLVDKLKKEHMEI